MITKLGTILHFSITSIRIITFDKQSILQSLYLFLLFRTSLLSMKLVHIRHVKYDILRYQGEKKNLISPNLNWIHNRTITIFYRMVWKKILFLGSCNRFWIKIETCYFVFIWRVMWHDLEIRGIKLITQHVSLILSFLPTNWINKT